jgi:hypothetical protein
VAGEDGLRTSEALEQVRSREEGLLLLYPISRYSKGQTKDAGICLTTRTQTGSPSSVWPWPCPGSDSPATRRYIVGSAGAVTG